MDHAEILEWTRDMARRTLDFLERHDLPPDPCNFTIGYIYFDGSRPEIRTEVDSLMSSGTLNSRSCRHLHDAVFGLDAEARAIRVASDKIERTLGKVLQALDDAGKDVKSYGAVLADISGRVDANSRTGGNVDELRRAIEEILVETRKMEARSAELERRFAETGKEVSRLRRDLDETRVAANTDSLTGIANRKHFDLRLREYADDAERTGEPLSLLLGDIDHFKTFNDAHGHPVGDMVLRLVAHAMAESVRGRDFVARYGGEEFAVLLPKTGLAGALAVADNLRNAIASKRIARKSTGETLGMVTLSFGVAQFRPDELLDDLVRRADQGLYEAKRGGRNRVDSVDPMMADLRRNSLSA